MPHLPQYPLQFLLALEFRQGRRQGDTSPLQHSFTHQPSKAPPRTRTWEEEDSPLFYSTCSTVCVAGLQFLPVTFTQRTSKCRRRVGGRPEERLAWASIFLLHHPGLLPSLSFSHPLLPYFLGQPALILPPHLFHSCCSSTPEPGPHARATGAITSSPGGPGRPATGLGASPWLTQQCPLLTYAAENRRGRTHQHQESLSIQYHLLIQSPPLAQHPLPPQYSTLD